MKLDDDVFVNMRPLTSHLINLLDENPLDTKFIYCHAINMAKPQRKNISKWFVTDESYPFEYYPRYCEGFSYVSVLIRNKFIIIYTWYIVTFEKITNVNTIQLMQQQSKLIPRLF